MAKSYIEVDALQKYFVMSAIERRHVFCEHLYTQQCHSQLHTKQPSLSSLGEKQKKVVNNIHPLKSLRRL